MGSLEVQELKDFCTSKFHKYLQINYLSALK